MKKIDAHAHYGYWPFPILADSESDLLQMLTENEIEKCILSSAKAVQYDFVAGNQELKPLLDRNPALYGYITLNSKKSINIRGIRNSWGLKSIHRMLGKRSIPWGMSH
jgi:hypothetical protein